jgi:hypothetical protein
MHPDDHYDELVQLAAAYVARRTASIRLWYFDTVMEAALGWDNCHDGTPLEQYPAPVRVQAVARVLRARVDRAGDQGIDPAAYIRSTHDSDLVDDLRHCTDELEPELAMANATHETLQAARAEYYDRLLRGA